MGEKVYFVLCKSYGSWHLYLTSESSIYNIAIVVVTPKLNNYCHEVKDVADWVKGQYRNPNRSIQ